MALLKLISKLGFIGAFVLAFMTYREQTEWEQNVLAPKQAEINTRQGILQRKINEVKNAEQFLADRDQKKKQLFELREEVDRQAKSVPQRVAIPEVLAELDSRADKTGLIFSKFSPQASSRQNVFLVLTPFTVKLRGTYTQIMSFLDAAANMERTVTTQSLVVDSPSLPKAGASILNAEATMIAFHIDPNALVTAVSGTDKNQSAAAPSAQKSSGSSKGESDQ